jgi:hypothetical protein
VFVMLLIGVFEIVCNDRGLLVIEERVWS